MYPTPTRLLLLLVFCPMLALAQLSDDSAVPVLDDLFYLQNDQNQGKDFVTEAVFYHLNPERLRQIERERPFEWTLQLPQADKSALTIHLQKHQIIADNFKVNTPNGEVRVETGVFYKGWVQSDKNSHVAISIFNDHLVGFLSFGGTTHELGHLQQGIYPVSTDYIFYDVADMLVEKTFECGTDDTAFTPSPNDNPEPALVSASNKVVKIYIEADYDTYLDKGSSVQNATNYIQGFFNEVAVIYSNESINIQISEIFVWTTQDPYTGTIPNPFNPLGPPINIDGSGASLQPFADRMIANGFNGNIAHLIQMVNTGNDGLAFIDELCPANAFDENTPYAYSDVESSYLQYPAYSWTVQVFAHENGHVIAAPHTTTCNWGPNDNQRLEPLCPGEFPDGFCSTVSPAVTETMMNPGCVIPDFTKGFGTEPGNLLRDRVSNGNCLDNLTVPLDVLQFDGIVTEKGNQIRWRTANEINTKWHIVERSPDGKKGFTEAGRVIAAGYATQQRHYQWLDTQALAEAYYRLKTLDIDGHEHFSDVIRLERNVQSTPLRITKVYPVPATDWLQLQFQTTENQDIKVQLIDMLGRIVLSLTQKSTEGANILNLDTSALAAGVYTLQLTGRQGQPLTQNVVIQ